MLVEKKIWVFLVVICCSTVVYLNRYFKRTKQEVVDITDRKQGNNSRNSIPSLMLGVDTTTTSSLSNATNISGVSVTSAPVQNRVDLHMEDPVLGHAGEVTSDHISAPTTSATGRRRPRATIAIGGGITSRGIVAINESNIASQLLLYSVFLPSFCRTASREFAYRIYLAYDHTDPMFSGGRLQTAFRRTFDDEIRRLCASNDASGSVVDVSLHLVECSHAGKPTWAQNDAMLEAYLDHVDYFYRINDDTRMLTGGWTEKFISTLESYDPPRVGVVGPNHHGGNVAILTYDFVHRTHVDLFGFYYPRLFTSWWADDWITMVYSPYRSTKVADVQLSHTMSLGQRYVLEEAAQPRLVGRIEADKQTVNRYVILPHTLLASRYVVALQPSSSTHFQSFRFPYRHSLSILARQVT